MTRGYAWAIVLAKWTANDRAPPAIQRRVMAIFLPNHGPTQGRANDGRYPVSRNGLAVCRGVHHSRGVAPMNRCRCCKIPLSYVMCGRLGLEAICLPCFWRWHDVEAFQGLYTGLKLFSEGDFK